MAKSQITVSITLRGEPAAVVAALAHGLPVDVLEGIRDGTQRAIREARGRREIEVAVSKAPCGCTLQRTGCSTLNAPCPRHDYTTNAARDVAPARAAKRKDRTP